MVQSEIEKIIQDAKRRNLQTLDLSDMQITVLPESIGQLSSLQSLALSGTQITALPESIGQLSSLRELYLSRTPITALPESIGQLSSLQALDLYDTQITALPESIGQLSSLQELYLYNSQITALPESIGQLSSLQSLYLRSSNITALPESIGQLSSLQSLDLSYTQITALPESIGQLSSLQALNLYNTQITALPESIGQLSSLQSLDLCNCHLKSIPYGLVNLGLPFVIDDFRADDCINLSGVTLDEGDLSLFAQPREVIEAYYQNLTAKALNECKVIFLGDGAAGKSSLIERIIHDNFQEGALPTDGIKMTKWETALGEKPLTIRFLDFGGQEIMHSMHRCFLTNHTVYIVVCESRDDAEIDSVAARWMETVKSFAPECPVILALNKSDLNPHVTVNERDLKRINPQYRHTLHTSAKTGEGVQQLVNSVLREVPDCLKKMSGNAAFLGLKQDLENMEADYLLPEQFREKCDHFQIAENLRRGVIDWFQDLGVAYVYSMTFRDIYVLNPAWLTNGIYRLILRTPNGGFLQHSTIRETLQEKNSRDIDPEKTYSAQEMEFILYVMREFEISHYIGNDEEMIPMKMDKTPPPRYDDFIKGNALHLRWEGAYLPNNLIHRLIIRKFPELDTKCVWRTGGHFWQNKSGNACEALAEMDDNALDVYVIGSRDRRQYMEAFRSEIWNILTGFNLHKSVTEMICYKVDGREGYIPYEDVIQQYYDGMEKIYIPGIKSYISPVKLLQETYMDWKKDAELRGLRDGVVISLADRDEKTPDEIDLERRKLEEEIENLRAERDRTVSETTTNRIRNAALIAAAAVLITLATARPDLLSDLFPQILEFFQGLFG